MPELFLVITIGRVYPRIYIRTVFPYDDNGEGDDEVDDGDDDDKW